PSTVRARYRPRRRAVARGDATDRRRRTVDRRPTSGRCRLTPGLCHQPGRRHPRPPLKRRWAALPAPTPRPSASADRQSRAPHEVATTRPCNILQTDAAGQDNRRTGRTRTSGPKPAPPRLGEFGTSLTHRVRYVPDTPGTRV